MGSAVDVFQQMLGRVQALLQQELRVSYRRLKREFGLNDDDIEDIRDELIHARKLAVDEDGKVLVWQPAVAQVAAKNYTPKHLADKILSLRSAIEGEKKQVTVMFCDVMDSMTLAEQLGAEEWHTVLNEFFALLSSAVHQYEGTVNQYTGDGVMALFGAPIAAEDHALRACMAAQLACENLRVLQQRLESEHAISFAVRFGLNSGEVVVASIGDDLRMDYTAQGQVVGIAARMEAMARANRIVLSEYCARHVAGLCELVALGPQQIKGVSRPLEVFELGHISANVSRFDQSRQRGLTRFVGRESELAVLHQALEQAYAGNGQVVGVVAEAGTGKSRLCYEFLERCKASGYRVNTGQALAHGKHIPYLPMLQIFRAYYGITDADDDPAAREKISSRMLQLAPDLKDALPILYEFFGVAHADQSLSGIAPEAKQRQIFNVLRVLVQAADPRRERLVAYIEDLHWLDDASEAFLQHWVEALAGSSSILLVNFRPEYRAPWMRKSHYRQLPLAALTASEVHTLLAHLLGDATSVTGLSDVIYARTGGNPFFCEEVVTSMAESGALQGAPGQYELVRPIETVEIPASVQAVLTARIDRLPDDEKQLLQTAAVIGREFSKVLLGSIMELHESALTRTLTNLSSSEFIFQRTRGNQPEYVFKHALTQEVALNSQLSGRRAQTHAQVARAIEVLHADQPVIFAPLIAHHWEAAGELQTAADWWLRSADHIGTSDIVQAMHQMQSAVRLTAALPESEIRNTCRLKALVGLLIRGGWRVGLSRAVVEGYFEEAQALVAPLNDADTTAIIKAGYGASVGINFGDVKTWSRLVDDVSEARDKMTPYMRLMLMGTNRGYTLFIRGRLAEAVADIRALLEAFDGDYNAGREILGFSAVAQQLMHLSNSRAYLGHMHSALQDNRAAEATLKDPQFFEEWLWLICCELDIRYLMGTRPEAAAQAQVLSRTLDACTQAEARGSNFSHAIIRRRVPLARMLHGDTAFAAAQFQQMFTELEESQTGLQEDANIMVYLADAQLLAGDIASAEQSARRSVARAQEQQACLYEIRAQIALARALLAQQRTAVADEVAQVVSKAMVLVEQTGARALHPQVMEQNARLKALLGQAEQARAEFKDAHALYVAVGAHGHAQRLAQALPL